jgi:MinD-like ATPase involved in chromosome partitioning or flagellar assembly
VDGTETGWGRPAEPAPRWRALLDRARHGARTADESPEAVEEPTPEDARAARQPSSQPAPPGGRPANPLDRRPYNPLAEPPRALEPRPVNPLDRRPANPLDRRPIDRHPPRNGAEPRPSAAPPAKPIESRPIESRPIESRPIESRPATPIESRPVNPLDARRQSRIGEGFQARAEAEHHSFFNPNTRSVPPPATRVPPPPDNGYPPARAAASVGSAAVLPPAAPPAPPAAPPASPTSPAPAAARIEWRQAQPEQETDRAVAIMRRKLGRPRVVAFANPKGGVHKTTATVLAAATIGSVRGRGVLAWDDNELRGTLGLRAGSARHARTIRHLLADLMQIENLHGDDLLQELDGYLRHASDGSYDVLAGEENPRFAQRLDQHTVRRVMDLLRRTHDVICVDTGNNVESVNWQTVMKAADQLVITTVPREDAAFTADWMLDLLNDTGMEDLVANAVTLISCPSPGPLPLLEDLKKHFATRTRAVAVVPYDPALEVGSSIEYSDLLPDTRQAWRKAASVMIEPFAE